MNKFPLRSTVYYFLLFMLVQIGVSLAVGAVFGFWHSEIGEAEYEKLLLNSITKITMITLAVSSLLTIAIVFVSGKVGGFSVPRVSAMSGRLGVILLCMCFIAGFTANFWVSIVMSALPIPQEMMESYAQASAGIDSSITLLNVVTVSFLTPLCEELIYRGMILGRLIEKIPPAIAVIIQGVLFGMVHGDPIWVIYAAILGCVLGYIRVCTGSLWGAIVFHIAFNMCSFTVGFLNGASQGKLLAVLVGSGIMLLGSMYTISRCKIKE